LINVKDKKWLLKKKYFTNHSSNFVQCLCRISAESFYKWFLFKSDIGFYYCQILITPIFGADYFFKLGLKFVGWYDIWCWKIWNKSNSINGQCIVLNALPQFQILKEIYWLMLKFIYSEKATKFCEIPPYVCLYVQLTKVKWRFRKILWPSQDIRTLAVRPYLSLGKSLKISMSMIMC
jgi:hypothetical protein